VQICQILKISGAMFYRSIKTGVSDAANRMAVDTLRVLSYSSTQSRASMFREFNWIWQISD
jgi:hypothetical protein